MVRTRQGCHRIAEWSRSNFHGDCTACMLNTSILRVPTASLLRPWRSHSNSYCALVQTGNLGPEPSYRNNETENSRSYMKGHAVDIIYSRLSDLYNLSGWEVLCIVYCMECCIGFMQSSLMSNPFVDCILCCLNKIF